MSNDDFVTVWSRGNASFYWLVERTYTKRYAIEVLGLPEEAGAEHLEAGRLWCWLPKGQEKR